MPHGGRANWVSSKIERMAEHELRNVNDFPVARLEELFRQQVCERGDAAAIVAADTTLSYADVDAASTAIALALGDFGALDGGVVATLVDDPVLQIESLLGVLKSGVAFVCLDPCHPDDRLASMFADVRPTVLLADASAARHDRLLQLAHESSTALLVLDGKEIKFRGRLLSMDWSRTGTLPASERVGDTAYLVYTSGSTGKPKGIVQSHRSFSQFLDWQAREIGIGPGERFIQWASIGYDASYCEIFGALCFGATLLVEHPDVRFNPARLVRWLGRSEATIFQTVPSFCNQVLDVLPENESLPHLRSLMLAGEALTAETVRRWLQQVNSTIHNLYGPSESVLATYHRIELLEDDWTHIPIGKAIDGRQILLLDKDQGECPAGMPGEIYIRSGFLTSGYFGLEDENKLRFVQNPLHDDYDDPVFRTGDIARRRSDGILEFIGRADRMVKLRGMRVELGEIEHAVRQFDGIEEVVCQVRILQRHRDRLTAKDRAARDALRGGSQFLVAYYTTTRRVLASELRNHVRSRLPAHMVPQQFVELDEMPRNVNRKLDVHALPDPANVRPELDVDYRAPETAEEVFLATIWSQVLGINKVGVNDGFFDVGGDSLLGMQIINRAAREGMDLETRVMLRNGSITELLAATQSEEREAVPMPVKVSRREYPLTFAQWGLWYLWRLDPANPFYTAQGSVHLGGALDIERWLAAWKKVVARHQSLHARFATRNGEPVQIFDDMRAADVDVVDLRELGPQGAREEMDRLNTELGRHAFDLENDQLLRAHLYRLADDHFEFVMTYHEIIFDLWGYAIIIRDIAKCYSDPAAELSPGVDIGDMAVWEASERTREKLGKQDAFWRNELTGELPLIALPLDRPRRSVPNYAGSGATKLLGPELSERIRELAATHGTSLFTTLLTAFNVLLRAYSSQDDSIIGATVANRGGQVAEDIVGWYVNMLPVRLHAEDADSFSTLLTAARDKTTECIANADYPFHWMVEHAEIHRDQSVAPVFQVMFNWQNLPQESIEVDGLTISSSEVDSTFKKYDLALYAQEHLDRIYLQFSYLEELFDHETVERMLANFVVLLEGFCTHPQCPIVDLPAVSAEEHKGLLESFNQTRRPLTEDFGLAAAFEECARAYADDVALTFRGESLRYADLHKRVNAIATPLFEAGVGKGDVVAMCLDRGFDTIAAVVAAVKLGAVSAAIDPTHPSAHRQRILMDTRASVFLFHTAHAPTSEFAGTAIAIEDIGDAVHPDLPTAPQGPDDIYNLVYTSGTTGLPKGVLIPYRALQNRLEWMWNAYPWQAGDVALLQKSYAIVASSWEIWGSLLKGVPTVIADYNELLDPVELWRLCVDNGVTHLLSSPALITSILSQAEKTDTSWPSLRFATTSAEAISPALVRRWQNAFPDVPLLNLYGSTECSSNVTVFDTDVLGPKAQTVPIGKPIDNCSVYVLNSALKPVPRGAVGEMCVSGACLAAGYHGDTGGGRHFVASPFGAPGERLYRTGDIVRLNNAGDLEVIGREDQQVNVRGFRVELGGIEACLASYPAIDKACARVWRNGDECYLSAYYSASASASLPTSEVRKFLRERLPDYMVPQFLFLLPALPQTASGKIDRTALPMPAELEPEERSGTEPASATERSIAEIWKSELGVDTVYREDFFFDIGGHSLLAVSAADKIEKTLGVNVPFRTLVFNDLRSIAETCGSLEEQSLLHRLKQRLQTIAGRLRSQPPSTGP